MQGTPLFVRMLFLIGLVPLVGSAQVPVYFQFNEEKIFIVDDNEVEITSDLYVGAADAAATDLHTLVFDIAFPAELLLLDSTAFYYKSGSFLGDSDDVIVLQDRASLDKGRLGVILSRKGNKGVNGFGKIGTLKLVIIGDIIGSLTAPEVPFNIRLENLQLFNANGIKTPSYTDPKGATVLLVRDILANFLRQSNDKQLIVFPNPASNYLYISLQNLQSERLEVFNMLGQRVYSAPALRSDYLYLSVEGFERGYYFLKVHTKNGILSRKFLVK